MKTLHVDGSPIAYLDRGAGPPVLLLHGNPDTSAMWEPLVERLEAEFRCIAPDLPGFGASGLPNGLARAPTLEAMAAFVDAFADACGVREPLHLVVHDVGGFFGLAWAVRRPERVRSLVVSNTLFFSDYRWHVWARVWRTPGLGELAMALLNRWSFARELRRGSPGLPDAHILRSYAAYGWKTRRWVLRLYRATDPADFRGWEDELVALTRRVPTLVLWGERDPYIPPRYAARFGAAEVRRFSGHGHWLAVEAPDAFAAHLRHFWSGPTRSPG